MIDENPYRAPSALAPISGAKLAMKHRLAQSALFSLSVPLIYGLFGVLGMALPFFRNGLANPIALIQTLVWSGYLQKIAITAIFVLCLVAASRFIAKKTLGTGRVLATSLLSLCVSFLLLRSNLSDTFIRAMGGRGSPVPLVDPWKFILMLVQGRTDIITLPLAFAIWLSISFIFVKSRGPA